MNIEIGKDENVEDGIKIRRGKRKEVRPETGEDSEKEMEEEGRKITP